jgi:3-oxoacyl-(acyl-carrier-protein) synthase
MNKYRARINAKGIVTAFGIGCSNLWDGLIYKKSAIKDIKGIDLYPGLPAVGAQIKDEIFNMQSFLELGQNDKNSMLFLIGLAIQDLLKTGNLDISFIKDERISIFSSMLKGNIIGVEKFYSKKAEALATGKTFFLSHPASILAGILGSGNTVRTVSNACASGTIALALAADEIYHKKSCKTLIVAADLFAFSVQTGFASLGALSHKACKPFDINRNGLTLGEGSAAIVLEREETGNGPFILGWGISNDANHITAPSKTGEGLRRAIQNSLSMADMSVEKIGAIVAHGTGTKYNDSMEALAFKSVFPKAVPPICGIKGAIGHTSPATGLIEAAVAVDILKNNFIPPTVGLEKPEHDGLNFSGGRLEKPVILSTNSGFGGINAAVLIGYDDR